MNTLIAEKIGWIWEANFWKIIFPLSVNHQFAWCNVGFWETTCPETPRLHTASLACHDLVCRAQNIEIWEGLPWFWLGQDVFGRCYMFFIVPHNRNLWEDLGSGVRRWMVSRSRRSRQTTCFSYGKLMPTACSRSSRWWLSLGKNLDGGLNVGLCPWIKCDIDEERSTAAWNYFGLERRDPKKLYDQYGASNPICIVGRRDRDFTGAYESPWPWCVCYVWCCIDVNIAYQPCWYPRWAASKEIVGHLSVKDAFFALPAASKWMQSTFHEVVPGGHGIQLQDVTGPRWVDQKKMNGPEQMI